MPITHHIIKCLYVGWYHNPPCGKLLMGLLFAQEVSVSEILATPEPESGPDPLPVPITACLI